MFLIWNLKYFTTDRVEWILSWYIGNVEIKNTNFYEIAFTLFLSSYHWRKLYMFRVAVGFKRQMEIFDDNLSLCKLKSLLIV